MMDRQLSHMVRLIDDLLAKFFRRGFGHLRQHEFALGAHTAVARGAERDA